MWAMYQNIISIMSANDRVLQSAYSNFKIYRCM